MEFSLFPYQVPIVEAAVEAIRRGDKEVLVAACPGAGKTEMAFEIVRRLVAEGAIDQALMLTWLRRNLKTQTQDRLEQRLVDLKANLRIDIPQQGHKISGKFDLLIQDEAHQGYDVDGGMVENIKAKVKTRSTLLLTGSPSTFIKRGLKPISVFALEDLHQAGRASDLTIEVGTSAYNILEDDFNDDGDIKTAASARGTQRQTDETLDSLLDGLFNRLKLGRHSMGWWNRTMLKTAKKGWNSILTALKKTIIACRDIQQAEQVAAYFRRKKVETLVSHSKLDADSENIDAFRTSAAPLLVVVDRAQLGYDNPDLVNFVDMTGSKNPDRIFQMLCRVVRPGNVTEKLFVKVMPASFADRNLLFFMEGVLNLSRREIFETYDGTGFYRQEVPSRPRRPREAGKRPQKAERAGGIVEPALEPGMALFGPSGYFTAISHTNHDGYEAIGQVRLGDVVGRVIHDSEGTKGRVLAFYRDSARWPSSMSADPEESRLGYAMRRYVNPARNTYDSEFAKKVAGLGYLTLDEKTGTNKDAILAFHRDYAKWPYTKSKDPSEKRLGVLMFNYIRPTSDTYDPEFHRRVLELGYQSLKERSGANKEVIFAFLRDNSRAPRQRSKDPTEKRLGRLMNNYVSPASGSYDPDFVKALEKAGWVRRKPGRQPSPAPMTTAERPAATYFERKAA